MSYVSTNSLCAVYDLEHPHHHSSTKISREDVVDYIEAFSVDRPPFHPTSAIAYDLNRTFGPKDGRRLLLHASRWWDSDPMTAREVISLDWDEDYEALPWVDEYLSEVIGDWRDQQTIERVQLEKEDAAIARHAERTADQMAMRDLAEAEWLGFNGSTTPECFEDWKEKFKHLALPFQRQLPPLSIVPSTNPPIGTSMPPNLQIVPAAPQPDMLTSSRDFVAGFVPPEYLIDDTVQRRYFYSMTAQTGVGKTAIAMRWMAQVVAGRAIGSREVQQGDVLYLAGENPQDVLYRWIVLSREMDIDPETDRVTWLVGTKDLNSVADAISAEVARKNLNLALIVVDTAAAYNFGDNENDNTQAGNYARQLRSLVNLPGGPCVIALCHPTKRAADDDLMPRGGGAFLAEVDGNMAVARKDAMLVVTPFGKFRGSMSWSHHYEIEVVKDHPKLKDARGRQMSSVVARPVHDGAVVVNERRADTDMMLVLNAVQSAPASTATDLARFLGWTYGKNGDLNHTKVKRHLDALEKQKLVKSTLGRWKTSSAGQQALNDADTAAATQPKPMFPMPLPPHTA